MLAAVKERYDLAKEMVERPWFKIGLLLWAVISIWDTALSQLVPETISKDAPRAYQIAIWLLNMTGGWLSIWGWLLIGAALVVFAALEFAFRTLREDRLRQRYAQPATGHEKGFLDFQADGQQAIEDLTNATLLSNKDTERFAKGIVKYGTRIQYISKPSWRRRYASRAAKYICAYAGRLQKTTDFVGSVTPVIAENQTGMIEQEMNVDSLKAFAAIVGQTTDAVLPSTIEALEGMRQSTASIRGISADLNAASTMLENVLGNYIEKLKNYGDVAKKIQMSALSRIEKLSAK